MTQSSKTRRQVNAVLGILAVLIGAVVAGCNSFAPPTTLASPMVEATTGSSATVSVEPSPMASPSGTPEPFPVSEATVIEVTRRASYAERATQAVRDGQPTLEPYETIWARETSFQLERTRFAESLFTPTPFGALPFPGTRLTDEELAERGWPRMGPGGIRNEDYHTTAFWLDKEYVDAEIFSKYEALFDLLAFRDGPPGEDFEARLGELMLANEPPTVPDAEVIKQLRFGETLESCSREVIARNIAALKETGRYLQMDSSNWYSTQDLFWRAFQYDFPLHREIGAFTTERLTAFQIGDYFLAELEVDYPGSVSEQFPVVDFTLRALPSGNNVKQWQDDFSPESNGAHAVFIWTPESGEWYVFRIGSVYCDDYFQTAVHR